MLKHVKSSIYRLEVFFEVKNSSWRQKSFGWIFSDCERELIGLLVKQILAGLSGLYLKCPEGHFERKWVFEKVDNFWSKGKWAKKYELVWQTIFSRVKKIAFYCPGLIFAETDFLGMEKNCIFFGVLWTKNSAGLSKFLSIVTRKLSRSNTLHLYHFCKFIEFCGKKSRQALQNFLLFTVGAFREYIFAGKTKTFS